MKILTPISLAIILSFLVYARAETTPSSTFLNSGEFSVSLSMSFSTVDSMENAVQFVAKSSLKEFMSEQVALGNESVQNLDSLRSIELSYLQSHDSSSYEGMSLKEKAQTLANFVFTTSGVELPSSLVLSDLAIDQLVANPNQWKESLTEIREVLNFEEKIRLTAYLGGKFSSDYNSARSQEGLAAEGIVSIEEMLENLSNDDPGGICRDVTLAQSQILQELGVDKGNIYQMSYAVGRGHHAVLLVQDPNNPRKVIKINYSLIQSNENISGASSLSQDGILADTGIVYKIYDADGKSVANIPSEMGQILREVTNYQDSLDQGIRSYGLTKTIVKSKWVDATLFSGQLSNGESVNGISLNRNLQFENSYKEFGLAYLERRGSNKADSTIDQKTLFFRFKEIQSRQKQIGPILITARAGAEIEGALLISRIEVKSSDKVLEGKTIDAHGSFFAGTGIEYATDAATYMADIDFNSVIDFNNLAGAASSGYGIFLDEVKVSAGVETQVNSDTKVTGKVMLTFKNVGEVAGVNLGLDKAEGQSTLEFNYQTPISEMPIFLEGATETFRFGASQALPTKRRLFSTGRFYVGGAYDKTVNQSNGQVGIEFKF